MPRFIYCGKRVTYYKPHLTGLCMHPPHHDSLEHIIEVVSVDTSALRYDQLFKETANDGLE